MNIKILAAFLFPAITMASENLPTPEHPMNPEIEAQYLKCMDTIESVNETYRKIGKEELITLHCAVFKEEATSPENTHIKPEDLKSLLFKNTLLFNPTKINQ